MFQYLLAAIVAVGLSLMASLVVAGHRYVTRPTCRCSIPTRDYQFKPVSPASQAVSAPAVRLVREVDGVAEPADIKIYQVLQPQMQNGHCSISRVTLRIHPDGRWSISCVAQQNALPEDQRVPSEPRYFTGSVSQATYTEHLLRNEFCVRIRGYANYGSPPAQETITAGPPLMFNLEPPKFWVQRGQTQHWSYDGPSHAGVREFFDLADRVEVEFSYH